MLFQVDEVIKRFDQFLCARHLNYSCVIIGGAALTLLHIISRATKDIDVLTDRIPDDIDQAARDFARTAALSEHWFNSGPSDLMQHLPRGWQTGLQLIFQGEALTLYTLARLDLIRVKIWALCDRQKDLPDVIALAPTVDELDAVAVWLKPLDANPQWPSYIDSIIAFLKKELHNAKP